MRCRKGKDVQRIRTYRLVICLSVAVLALVNCMDPGEYEPEEPPQKTDPPGPPSAVLPLQDTVFRSEYSHWVTLDWTSVDSAEGYEFQVCNDSTFYAAFPYQGQFPPFSFCAMCYPPLTTYYFRVRAYSDAWIWYTDWSNIRRFHLIPVEDDTIFPPN
jgi:hypothetical protein